MIEEALRKDELPQRPAFFRYAVMRRIRSEIETPPLRFPWRVALPLAVVGGVAGAFVLVPLTAVTITVLALLVVALVVPAV